jgi:hypothetical protein
MFTALDLLSLERGAVIFSKALWPLAWRTAEQLVKNWKSIAV